MNNNTIAEIGALYTDVDTELMNSTANHIDFMTSTTAGGIIYVLDQNLTDDVINDYSDLLTALQTDLSTSTTYITTQAALDVAASEL